MGEAHGSCTVTGIDFPRRAHRRGHPMVLYSDRRWRWACDGRFVPRQSEPGGDRDCALCGLAPTPDGYDACIGRVVGAKAACCGHGVAEPYVMWEDGSIVRGESVPWGRPAHAVRKLGTRGAR
jgi:hypothetical protein